MSDELTLAGAGGWWLVAGVMFLGFAVGCGSGPHKTEVAASASVAVQPVAVAAEQWPSGYEATGTVRARTAAVISSKVMGNVREVRVQAGDHVRDGQLMVLVDARDLEANYRRAEAGREEAGSTQAETGHAIAAAKAQLDLAKATFGRMKDLFEKKSISNQEFDEATARLKSAEAGYEMAQARREQVRARIAQAEQEVESAGIMRGYAEIRAPFAGMVTAKTVEPGSLATPGAPLVTIEREGAYRLEALVDESRVKSIRAGQAVSVTLEALDRTIEARVSEIVPAVDAASRAYLVKIELPPLAQLRSGMFGRAVFAAGTRAVVTVPASAVIERGQLQSVMVVENGGVHTRLVTTGEKRDGRVEVLSGLSGGERVEAKP